ncbi:hypothetical protein [Parasitella parasitica]|uniref:PH domain-containing protein n=1 Tax=Parasitella parasitica TaxID=35722 RepID=A0A0B7N7S6_9FUNG|nr:hypothetical protein [Parasitella parasitica]
MDSSSTPLSGWLHKLTTANTFGASRWQSRYFVLLDSEMRYYKDEHSVNASRTVNLGDIAQVIKTSLPNHPFCFRLEPTLYAKQHQYTKQQKKIWTMKCKSQIELDLWVSALNYRLYKLVNFVDSSEEEEEGEAQWQEQKQDEEPAGIVSPRLQPFSTPEQRRSQPFVSLIRVLATYSSDSFQQQQNINPQSRPLTKPKPSISRRRGVILSPLDIESIPGLDIDMLASTSSRESSIPSPAAEIKDEEFQNETNGRANKLEAHNAHVFNTSSPSFALYKERYHL